jgi:hypothetical protein
LKHPTPRSLEITLLCADVRRVAGEAMPEGFGKSIEAPGIHDVPTSRVSVIQVHLRSQLPGANCGLPM